MSTYRRPGYAEYSYDFVVAGRRHTGNTGATNKREADRIEGEIRRQARDQARKGAAGPLTIAETISRYWEEVGAHHVNDDTTLTDLARIERWLGKGKAISTITDADVATLVAKRRADGVGHATINRSVTVRLRAVLARAENVWKAGPFSIAWGTHLLPEPQERIRELSSDEEAKLFPALAPGYREIARFALLSGCRLQECLDLEWRHIDWQSGYIVVKGKGAKTRHVPLHAALRTLLRPLPRAHARVFTHVVRRGSERLTKGARAPIEREGLKIHFSRTTSRLGFADFRFHDLRHTCATRLLRATGNLRLVKDLLGHADIATTLKYAHAHQDDMRAGLDAAFPAEIPASEAPETATN